MGTHARRREHADYRKGMAGGESWEGFRARVCLYEYLESPVIERDTGGVLYLDQPFAQALRCISSAR